MNRNRRYWFAAVLALGLGAGVAAVIYAPARLADSALDRFTLGRLRLLQAQGTLWSGSAFLAFRHDRGYISLADRLHWRLRFSWTSLQVELNLPCCATEPLRARIDWRLRGLRARLNAAQLQWPAEWLTFMGSPWNTLAPKGKIIVRTPDIFVDKVFLGENTVDGSASISLENMCLSLTTICPVGSYAIDIDARGGFALKTLSGVLQLSGSGAMVGGVIRFAGLAKADPTRLDALSNTLNLLGRRDGNTAHIFINPGP